MASIFDEESRRGGLSPDLDRDYLRMLDEELKFSEKKGIDRVSENLNDRGLLQSGVLLEDVAEQVLGPSNARRGQVTAGLARESAMLGREERLGEVNFERTRQLQQEAFERRLQEMKAQAQIQRELLMLQEELEGGGFGDFLGGLAGLGAGAFMGSVGGYAGGQYAKSLFGPRQSQQSTMGSGNASYVPSPFGPYYDR